LFSLAVKTYLRLVPYKEKRLVWLIVLEVQEHRPGICSASGEHHILKTHGRKAEEARGLCKDRGSKRANAGSRHNPLFQEYINPFVRVESPL
jgi:hypothetical protein